MRAAQRDAQLILAYFNGPRPYGRSKDIARAIGRTPAQAKLIIHEVRRSGLAVHELGHAIIWDTRNRMFRLDECEEDATLYNQHLLRHSLTRELTRLQGLIPTIAQYSDVEHQRLLLDVQRVIEDLALMR